MTTGRRPTLLLALALAATIMAACGSGDEAPVATAPPEATVAPEAPDPTVAPVTAAPVTTGPATAGPATTGPVTTAAGLDVSTTLGDLLTEDEVAEVERALDELDALLGEIDADLDGAPDP